MLLGDLFLQSRVVRLLLRWRAFVLSQPRAPVTCLFFICPHKPILPLSQSGQYLRALSSRLCICSSSNPKVRTGLPNESLSFEAGPEPRATSFLRKDRQSAYSPFCTRLGGFQPSRTAL